MLLASVSCKEKQERPWRELTVGLSWVHQAQFTGLYHADRLGLYAKERLRVSLVPATAEGDPLEDLLAGKHDLAIAQPDTLIDARARGHRVKAVAAIYRIHPLGFLALADSGITSPQDFRGKTVGIAYSERLILEIMLKKLGIPSSELTTVTRPYDFDDLRKGKLDVQAGWVTNELLLARREGLELNVIAPYDYGITLYADVLAARESLIEEDPELVQRFVRATMRGWAEALQDPAVSARLALHYDPDLDGAHEAEVLKATVPLIHTGVDRLGWMRAADWDMMIRALHEQGMISRMLPAEDVYTTRFLGAL